MARVDGRMLDRGRRTVRRTYPCTAPARRRSTRWLTEHSRAARALEVGALQFADEVPLALDAGGFDRHTFLCGQSGSGKTYALGTILERLLVQTSLRIVILDPNSDFVRLGETAARGRRATARPPYREAAARGRRSARAGASGDDRLHVRFRDFDADEQAAVFRLDPIADRDEYAALAEALESRGIAAARLGTRDGRRALRTAGAVSLARIARAQPRHRPMADLVGRRRGIAPGPRQPGGPRCVVADLGSLETREEQAVAAEAVLAALWRRRAAREPVLVVIDEAHNVCPARPEDRADRDGDRARRSHRRAKGASSASSSWPRHNARRRSTRT